MFKTKNILIAVIVIAVVGIGIYFISPGAPETTVPETEVPETEVPETETPEVREFQGIEYKIVQKGTQEKVGGIRMIYDIVTGELGEEQVRTLAEKIIGDITTENPSVNEVTLLFYADESLVGHRFDVARVDWSPTETSVIMIEE
ncbi:hypothetical protein ES703_26463 [subsurface metagenome]